MANKKEDLRRFFEIHETDEGRFLVEKKSQKRIVSLGTEKIEYLETKIPTIYHNFKVIGENGTGLMQLKYGGKVSNYTTITGETKSKHEILEMNDVMTIPTMFKDVVIDHILERVGERFGVNFPLAIKKNGDSVVFFNGEELSNTLGYKVMVGIRENGVMYIPQIICYCKKREYVVSISNEIIFSTSYEKHPKLNFISNADYLAIISPSYAPYKTDIWMYSTKNKKLGIVYIDSNSQIKDYSISDIGFSDGNKVAFINEHYIVYDTSNEKRLYFDGKYIGTISYFSAETRRQYFLKADKGFYIGKTFFDAKNFPNYDSLHQERCCKVNENCIKIYLSTEGTITKFLLDMNTGVATKCN